MKIAVATNNHGDRDRPEDDRQIRSAGEKTAKKAKGK
jgi:hypothetical protein